MRCPKSRFPIRIIVFDKLELIVKQLRLGTGPEPGIGAWDRGLGLGPGIGDWGMGNGEWGMGNGECGMRNEE